MKKYLITTVLIFISTTSQAFITWPTGGVPCNGTLQDCIDNSPEGEYIEIRTNGPINESIFSNNVVSLVAGNGYKPVFAATKSLHMNSNTLTDRTITIKGLTFTQGRIYMTLIGHHNTFNILNNTLLDNMGNSSGIHVNAGLNSDLTTNINFNTVNVDTSGTITTPFGAILINKIGGVGTVEGEIFGNTIKSLGIDSKGISLQDDSDGNFDFNITGNVIGGGTQGGLYVNRGAGTGTTNLDISSNSFYREGTFYFPSGIHIINDSGTTDVDIINNSMIDSRWGILLDENAGTLTADVQNNIVAYCGRGFDFLTGVTVSNDYNLYYQNNSNTNFTPGANSINANPQIKSMTNPRLRKGSPAEEAGNTLALLMVADAPFIDADGLLRIKRETAGAANVDMGAYERGDVYFNHVNIDTGSHISIINNPATNSQSTLDNLQITSNWNPTPLSIGIYNDADEALYYSGSNWRVFNEDISNIEMGASFNIAKQGANSATFQHLVTSSGSNTSSIVRTGLDGLSNKILQVSQHWTGVYNGHPTGVLYAGGNWRITNFDLADIPINSNFNIYYQEPSKSAWEHIANAQNSLTNYTYIDNPILNGNHCAQIQVTQSASQGVFNGSDIGVFYDTLDQKWAIFNQDFSAMPSNAAFYVLINPEQIADCTDLIFENDFE